MNGDFKWFYKVYFAGARIALTDQGLRWRTSYGELFDSVIHFPLGDLVTKYSIVRG
jgi:hypothetical protein